MSNFRYVVLKIDKILLSIPWHPRICLCSYWTIGIVFRLIDHRSSIGLFFRLSVSCRSRFFFDIRYSSPIDIRYPSLKASRARCEVRRCGAVGSRSEAWQGRARNFSFRFVSFRFISFRSVSFVWRCATTTICASIGRRQLLCYYNCASIGGWKIAGLLTGRRQTIPKIFSRRSCRHPRHAPDDSPPGQRAIGCTLFYFVKKPSFVIAAGPFTS